MKYALSDLFSQNFGIFLSVKIRGIFYYGTFPAESSKVIHLGIKNHHVLLELRAFAYLQRIYSLSEIVFF